MKEISGGKISIIIPVYNIEDYIEVAVKSVMEQTYKNIEIILVNDGSTDNSFDICNNLSKRDNRIQCIHQQNAGVSAARNAGLELSTGEYILFVDGDDEIASDMCKKLYDCIVKNKADIAYCGICNILSDKTIIYVPNKMILQDDEILYAFVTESSFHTSMVNKLFCRNILLDSNNNFITFPTEIYMGEDTLWLVRILNKIHIAAAVPEALYYYKRRENSATAGNDRIRTDYKFLTMLDAYKGMALEINNSFCKKIRFEMYLRLARNILIQAYKEHKYDLCNKMVSLIKEELIMYKYRNSFFIKLMLCVYLVQLKAPIWLVSMIDNIKKAAPPAH